MKKAAVTLAATVTALAASSAAFAEAPSNEELYEIIKNQQDQIDSMKKESNSGSNVKIGGYGELHYNQVFDGADELDFHRFVMFFEYDFSDDIRFVSEVELEHALSGDGKPGEVELEQAYVEFDLSDSSRVKGGVFLMPVGFLNETHEPPTFYGVERNPVEKAIIPTTWWEGGAMISGEFGAGFSYDFAVSSGLQTDNTFTIRGGRQKVAEAVANHAAYTGRIAYAGVPGLQLSAAVSYQADLTQDTGDGEDGAVLTNVNAAYEVAGFSIKALGAQWNIQGDAPKAADKDKQNGGYLEVGYKISQQVGVFGRYNAWDVGGADNNNNFTQSDLGVNYWPHENVVIKADVFRQAADADKSGFNLGIGYQF